MRSAGVAGVSRRKRVRTTHSDSRAGPARDLVERDFAVPARDRLWVANVPTGAGFLYLAVVLDACSRCAAAIPRSATCRTSTSKRNHTAPLRPNS